MSSHIAFFLPDLHAGGAEKVMLSIAEKIYQRGYFVDLVVSCLEGELSQTLPEGVNIINLGSQPASRSRFLFALQTVWRLSLYLRSKQPDCILSTLTGANLATVVAVYLAGLNTTSILLREASSLHNIGHFLTKWLVRWFYPCADAYIAVSQGIADDLVKTFGLRRSAVYVINNPVDEQKIARLAMRSTEHPWIADSSRTLVIAVGRLKYEKGYHYLIHEFDTIQDQTDARLLILGEGPQRKQLENLIESLNLSTRIDLPGYIDNPFPLVARAQLVVLSSQWEGFPNVLLQALALGIPIVATDCHTGPAEILDHGKFGQLIPYGQQGAMANAILDSLANPMESSILKARASDFSINHIVDQYQRLFDRLVHNKDYFNIRTDFHG